MLNRLLGLVASAALFGCAAEPTEDPRSRLGASSAALVQPTPLASLGGPAMRGDTNPFGLVEFADAGYFFQWNQVFSGEPKRYEMFRTDGTVAGTSVLHEREGYFWGSSPGVPHIVVFDGGMYWSEAYSLWKSDGTPQGTSVFHLYPSNYSNLSATDLYPFKDALYFGESGKLWRTDGTISGTAVVAGVNPLSQPPEHHRSFKEAGNNLFFRCTDGGVIGNPGVREDLCVTDGTPAGTRVLGVSGSTTSPSYQLLAAVGSRLVYSFRQAPSVYTLMSTDGTASGTQTLESSLLVFNQVAEGAALGGRFYFLCSTADGYELCSNDGTPNGKQVMDLTPGASTSPRSFSVLEDKLYFAGADGLWRTDGTDAGTVKIGAGFSITSPLTPSAGRLFFTGTVAPSTRLLFTSDGTAVSGGLAMPTAGYPFQLMPFRGGVLFNALDSVTGGEPFVSDGTDAGSYFMGDLTPDELRASARSAITVGDAGFFVVNHGPGIDFVWRTDGTPDGSYAITPQLRTSSPLSLLNGEPYAVLEQDAGAYTLSRLPLGAGAVVPIAAVPSPVNYALVRVGSSTLFQSGTGLWRTDGTTSGTVRVSNDVQLTGLYDFAVRGNELFFSCRGTATGDEPCVSDGTDAGTRVVADVRAGAQSSSPRYFTAQGGSVLFTSYDPSRGTSLFRTDGTDAGTLLVKDIDPASTQDVIWGLTSIGAATVFRATGAAAGTTAVWVTDGTDVGTTQLRTFDDFDTSSAPRGWNDRAFFSVSTGDAGRELWRTDGTVQGTQLVADLAAGLQSSYPSGFSLAGPNGPLYFVAKTALTGTELFRLDTPNGAPVLLTDLAKGPRSSLISIPMHLGGNLVFAGSTGTGAWLYSMPADVPPDTTPPTVSCPADVTVTTGNSAGEAVNYPAATASDDSGLPVALSGSPASGTLFAPGTTLVTVTATDFANNSASCTFNVIVNVSGAGGGGGSAAGGGAGGGEGGGAGGAGGGDAQTPANGCGCSAGAEAFALLGLMTALLRRRRR